MTSDTTQGKLTLERLWQEGVKRLVEVVEMAVLAFLPTGNATLLFGVFLRRAVMTSFLYVFLFEMLTANLPQSFAAFS